MDQSLFLYKKCKMNKMHKVTKSNESYQVFLKAKRKLKCFLLEFASFTIATVTIWNKNYFNWSQILHFYSPHECTTLPTVKWCIRSKVYFAFVYSIFIHEKVSSCVTSGHSTWQTAKKLQNQAWKRVSAMFSHYLTMKHNIHSCRQVII